MAINSRPCDRRNSHIGSKRQSTLSDQPRAIMGPEDVAVLLQKEGSGVPQDSYDEANEPADARQKRAGLLSEVLTTCYQLWESQSPELDLVAQKLGDGSRDGE